MREVVITGVGAVTPLGIGAHTLHERWSAGACAVLNALSAALGDEIYRRAPVTADVVLASLEAKQAELLLLRSNDLSYQEVAAALDLNPSSVGTLLSRAQAAFRKEYVKLYGEPRK